jgi:Cysteine rich repeat
MRQKVIRSGLGMFILTVVLAGHLFAQGTPKPATPSSPSQLSEQEKADRRAAMHQLNEACGEDMKKFCRHVQPGGGRIVQCLELQQSELSPNCTQWLNKMESQRKSQTDQPDPRRNTR